MERFQILFVRFWIALAAVSSLVPLAGCARESNPLPDIGITAPSAGSSGGAAIEHLFRTGAESAGHGAEWGLTMLAILIVPWLVIFLVPGFLSGRAEMPIEAGLILGFSALELIIGEAVWHLGLWPWLLVCDAIPALILLFWRSESGKITLFAVPGGVFALWCAWNLFDWIRRGFHNAPIVSISVGVIAGVLFIIFWNRRAKA